MKTLIYRINTKLMHVFFILESYLPHRIFWRYVTKKARKAIFRGDFKSKYVRMAGRHQMKVISKVARNFRKGK